jgi:hypothetical protein
MVGSSAASARMAVDLPVPRSPNTSTPPILWSVAAIRIASFISSWATMAENGNATGIQLQRGEALQTDESCHRYRYRDRIGIGIVVSIVIDRIVRYDTDPDPDPDPDGLAWSDASSKVDSSTINLRPQGF